MSKFDEAPKPPAGYNRQHLKCRTCGRIMWYDYVPYSLSNPIMTTICDHGTGQRDLGCDRITEEEARIEYNKRQEPKPVPKTCSTCKHWYRSKCGTGYTLGLGRCNKAVMFWDATQWAEDGNERELNEANKGTLAFVQDASDFSADLLTKPEFGCVSHEPKE